MDLVLNFMDDVLLDSLYSSHAADWRTPSQMSTDLCHTMMNSVSRFSAVTGEDDNDNDNDDGSLSMWCKKLPFELLDGDFGDGVAGADDIRDDDTAVNIGDGESDGAELADVMNETKTDTVATNDTSTDVNIGNAMKMNMDTNLNVNLNKNKSNSSYWLRREALGRQWLSLLSITFIAVYIMYFTLNPLNYFLFFDKQRWEAHPRYLKNQVRKEIWLSSWSMPIMIFLTVPWFVAEVRGHSLLYDNITDITIPFLLPFLHPTTTSYLYLILSILLFVVITDYWIYWIHRILHHPILYPYIHKPHHRWIVPTPFASHAFHPIDGYMQSLPYHFFIVTVPLWRPLYLTLYTGINIWTISIHDGEFWYAKWLERRNRRRGGKDGRGAEKKQGGGFMADFLNSSAHHSLHHSKFTVNYGQYFTFWDRIGGSYRAPDDKLLFPNEQLEDKNKKDD